MSIPNARKSGFTLVELLVVITIVGIVATGAVISINRGLQVQRQIQAVALISETIRAVRTNALSSDVDTSNPTYYVSADGLPTRNAFSFYICEGWVDPNDPRKTVADPADTSDTYDRGYTILGVNDPGHAVPFRVVGPDFYNGTSSNNITQHSSIESSVTLVDQLVTRQHFVNLPEGVIVQYAGAADDSVYASGAAISGCQHVTYDLNGLLIAKSGVGSFSAYSSSGFSGKEVYLAVSVGTGAQADPSISPIYIDLRTGDAVRDNEQISSITFPTIGP